MIEIDYIYVTYEGLTYARVLDSKEWYAVDENTGYLVFVPKLEESLRSELELLLCEEMHDYFANGEFD